MKMRKRRQFRHQRQMLGLKIMELQAALDEAADALMAALDLEGSGLLDDESADGRDGKGTPQAQAGTA